MCRLYDILSVDYVCPTVVCEDCSVGYDMTGRIMISTRIGVLVTMHALCSLLGIVGTKIRFGSGWY